MGLWPTHADGNPVPAPHPSLPEGAVENSPGQTLTLSEVEWGPAVAFRFSFLSLTKAEQAQKNTEGGAGFNPRTSRPDE